MEILNQHIEQNNPDSERQILYVFSPMWILDFVYTCVHMFMCTYVKTSGEPLVWFLQHPVFETASLQWPGACRLEQAGWSSSASDAPASPALALQVHMWHFYDVGSEDETQVLLSHVPNPQILDFHLCLCIDVCRRVYNQRGEREEMGVLRKEGGKEKRVTEYM